MLDGLVAALPEIAVVHSTDGLVIRDAWDGDIVYEPFGGLGGAPKLFSMGPDGEAGTDDDIIADEH